MTMQDVIDNIDDVGTRAVIETEFRDYKKALKAIKDNIDKEPGSPGYKGYKEISALYDEENRNYRFLHGFLYGLEACGRLKAEEVREVVDELIEY